MREKVRILLIDDDKVDAMTVIRALKELNISYPVEVAENGEVALEYLHNENNPRPDIILLDLNMPKMNGMEFLDIAKKDRKLKSIPVIVLTTSKDERDKMNCFDLGVAGYLLKPVDYNQFLDVVKVFALYWKISELPDRVA